MSDYYKQVALDYARHRRVHPEVLRQLIAVAPIKSDARVLEVGCGTGNYIRALRESVGCACWGVDPSESMLAQAKSRGASATFLPGRAEEVDLPADSFDLVFSVDVIHHVADRPGAFAESHRLLRSGGKTCIVTDSDEIIRNRQPMSFFFPETVAVDLARYPRMETMRAELLAAGFGQLTEATVEFAAQLENMDPYRARVFSGLARISDEAYARGIDRMEKALQAGPIASVSRYLMLWGTKIRSLMGNRPNSIAPSPGIPAVPSDR
jgi:ubiquinone/menaquinone biosynthesis C-methylase UbiE